MALMRVLSKRGDARTKDKSGDFSSILAKGDM